MTKPNKQLVNFNNLEPFFDKFFKHCEDDNLHDEALQDFAEECLLLTIEAFYGVEGLKFVYENQKHMLKIS